MPILGHNVSQAFAEGSEVTLGRDKPVHDIEPRSSAERDVFALAFESLSNAAIIFNQQLQITWRNQAATVLFPDIHFLPDALAQMAVEGGYEDFTAELRTILETGQARTLDLAGRGPQGEPQTLFSMAISPLHAPHSGEVVGGLLIAEDISGRIGMERRLAVSERLAAVGKLAARVAHELNNPLDGMLRFTNLALRRIGEPGSLSHDAKIGEYLEQVRAGAMRMRNIVSELLEFSRAAPDAFEQATIRKIVEDAVSALEGRAQESHVTVVCNFHDTHLPLAHGSALFQVFCNLVKNAIDAMPEGGTLTIVARVTGPDLIVSFEDDGVGLPAEAEKIFEPFFTTKAPGRGTGLGLAVCKELIGKYSGNITARPRAPKGTVFTVSIPTRNFVSIPAKKRLLSERAPARSAPTPQ